MKSIFSAAVLLLAVGTSTTVAGNPVYVGQRVRGTTAMSAVDHSTWNSLLQKYVDNDGYVNYQSWHSSQSDRQALNQYLSRLSQGNPQLGDENAKLAFWINAYNAVTVQGILREYPTTSIRNHTAKLVGYNIWKDLQLYVAGQPYSLEAIEHQILRKTGDGRIHFAIVCASIGCPRLLNQAYTPQDVQQQLEVNAKDFFCRPQNFRFDARTGNFQLSEIMNWYGSDFGNSQSAQLQAIAKWLPDNASRAAAQQGRGRISFLKYDWNLNDQKVRGRVTRR